MRLPVGHEKLHLFQACVARWLSWCGITHANLLFLVNRIDDYGHDCGILPDTFYTLKGGKPVEAK